MAQGMATLESFDSETALKAMDVLGKIRGYNWEKRFLAALLNGPVSATRSGYASIGYRETLELWQVGRFLKLGLITDRRVSYTEEIGSTPSSFDAPVASFGAYRITPVGRAVAAGLGITKSE